MVRKVDESDSKETFEPIQTPKDKELIPDVLSEADEAPETERSSNKEDVLGKHKKIPSSRLATAEDVEKAATNFKTLFDNFFK